MSKYLCMQKSQFLMLFSLSGARNISVFQDQKWMPEDTKSCTSGIHSQFDFCFKLNQQTWSYRAVQAYTVYKSLSWCQLSPQQEWAGCLWRPAPVSLWQHSAALAQQLPDPTWQPPTTLGQQQDARMQRVQKMHDQAHCLGHFWITLSEMFLNIPEQIGFILRYCVLLHLELILHLFVIRRYCAKLEFL